MVTVPGGRDVGVWVGEGAGPRDRQPGKIGTMIGVTRREPETSFTGTTAWQS